MSDWRQLSAITKIVYIGGLISFLALALMILTGMTGIGAIWELLMPIVHVTG